MARLEDALQYLSPDLINKINLNPSFVKTGILSAIKDLDPIEAANFIKETVANQMFSPDFEDIAITEEGGFGGGIDTSGIFSKAGDVVLNELGLPVSTANVQDVYSEFKEEGAGGGITEIAAIASDLVKKFGANYVISQLGINHPIANFIMKTPVGGDLRAMGSDIDKGFFGGYGGSIYNAINNPFNIFGSGIFGNKQNIVPVQEQVVQPDPVIVPKPDPIIRSPHVDPTPIPPPPATTNEAEVAYGGNVRDAGGSTTGSYGGGEDFGSPFQPKPKPRPRPTHHFAQGGLASMARVLRR